MGLDPKKKIANAVKKGGNLLPNAKSVFAAGAPFPLSLDGIGSLAAKAAMSKLKPKLPVSTPFSKPATVFIEGVPVPNVPPISLGKIPKIGL